MNEHKRFFYLLDILKRKLRIAHYLLSVQNFLALASVFFLAMAVSARFLIIIKLEMMLAVCLFLTAGAGAILAFKKRPGNTEAARMYDEYAGSDRVQTALSYISDTSAMAVLQRKDAIRRMQEELPKARQKKLQFFQPSKMVLIAICLSLGALSLAYPSTAMEAAEKREAGKEVLEEAKKELKKVKKVKDPRLAAEAEKLKKELQKAKTPDEALKKLVQKEAQLQKKKLEAAEKQKQMEQMKELARQNNLGGLAEAMEQSDSQELNKQLEKLLKEFPKLTPEQQKALSELIASLTGKPQGSLANLSKEQLDELMKKLGEQLKDLEKSAQSLKELEELQKQLQQAALSLNKAMANAGLGTPGALSFGNQPPSTAQGTPGANSGKNGGQKGGNSNGSGQGSGSGQGNGTGSGQGSGGAGRGPGGSGNAAGGSAGGFGQGSRELTIPQKVDGKVNQETDSGKMGEGSSEQEESGNGPVLKGQIRQYGEVYGEYEQSYRESLERMNLPDYLEGAVKDYFTDINPEGE